MASACYVVGSVSKSRASFMQKLAWIERDGARPMRYSAQALDIRIGASELRALHGLKNTLVRRIVCLGGPTGWACPQAPERARQRFQLDMGTVPIAEVNILIEPDRLWRLDTGSGVRGQEGRH
jgi:hypothetical protein